MGSEARKTPRPVYDVGHLPPGLEIAGWRILKRLDTGGYGVVYLVEDEEGVRGALKLALRRTAGAPPDPARTEERAQREMLSVLLAHHPNIVTVWAHGRYPHKVDGHFWFVMPFIEGDTLEVWARRHSPTLREVLRVFERLADALDAAHGLGILHRDIKAENIRVRRVDSQPVMLDFGAGAFPLAAPLTSETLPPGTITHRSPEAMAFFRLNENSSTRYESQPTDDLYALGVTFYEVLTGQLPFIPSDSPVAERQLAREIEFKEPPAPHALNPQVPPALGDIVKRLLAKQPLERHASAQALRRDLASLDSQAADWEAPLRMPGAPRSDARPTPLEPAPLPPARATLPGSRGPREALRAVAVVGLVVLALGVWAFLLRGGAPAQVPPRPTPGASGSTPEGTAPRETPATARAPMLPASPEKEGSTVKTPANPQKRPSTAPTPASPKRPALAEVCKTLAVSSAAWLAAGCSTVQVRPEPAKCPAEALAAMERFGVELPHREGYGTSVGVVLFDVQQGMRPEVQGTCTVKPGPLVGALKVPIENHFPKGTLLYGNVWQDPKTGWFTVLYLQADTLGAGGRVPVCITFNVEDARTSLGRRGGVPCAGPGYAIIGWGNER